jgi:hypothetical protein
VRGESPNLIFPNGFRPEEHIFNAHRIGQGEIVLVHDPLDALRALQNGIDNVVSFLTETASSEQLQMLAVLMDDKGADSLEFA